MKIVYVFVCVYTLKKRTSIRFRLFNFPEKITLAFFTMSPKYYQKLFGSHRTGFCAEYVVEGDDARCVKEKNKFDQSEGGSYRYGYGFRKHRRILFLRKPDKNESVWMHIDT